jgi:diguanylate cyclase (GGDEF)-like protein
LLNRSTFDSDLPEILLPLNQITERRITPRAGQKSVYLVMIDIDHFKRVNNRLGHLYGDEFILIFATLFRETLEPHERLYRYGDE